MVSQLDYNDLKQKPLQFTQMFHVRVKINITYMVKYKKKLVQHG